MQFGHMRRSHQSCPENLRSKQVLANSIANRSDDLASDAQSSTNVSSENKNEGDDAINSKADDNANANAVEAKVINGNARGCK
ncbi:hypothetical protein MAM1_0122d05884 [Mucor ambiguus]|uniref:Uncharacterized protein n=1 Tax=Mucor ambiguus TaxID=91626 RepID=A0A0C9MSS6_9FUNG|nr:hypothetical protein MAM1_0122d05884 [Mucor ambiguus]